MNEHLTDAGARLLFYVLFGLFAYISVVAPSRSVQVAGLVGLCLSLVGVIAA